MASRAKGIIVEIGGDTTGLQKALKSVNSLINTTQSQLKTIEKSLKIDPTNTELLADKQTELNKVLAQTSNKLEGLKIRYYEIDKYIKDGNTLTEEQRRQYENLKAEIVKTEAEYKKLSKEVSSFGSVSAQVLAAYGEKLKDAGAKIEGIGKKLAVVSAAASAVLGAISKTAIEFESAWTGVTKTVDGTEEELEQIRKGILQLATDTGVAAEEIAQVAETTGQLGVATNDVLDFTEVMIRLGDSTTVSANDAAMAIAQLYNVTKGDIKTVENFGAALVDLGNNTATTEDQILAMASRLASAASIAGMTEQEILGLAATLSSVGLEAEAGGSSISVVINSISKAIDTQGDTLKTWAQTAGMSVKDFSAAWKRDAAGTLQLVIAGMSDVNKSGKNLNVLLDELDVNTLRQSDTMRRLSNASEQLSANIDLSNKAWQENSALTKESEKRYQTTEYQIKQLKETLKAIGVELGEILLPTINKFVSKVKDFLQAFRNMNESTKKLILSILSFTAALSPILIILGKMIIGLGQLLTYAPAVVSAFSKIGGVIKGLFGLIAAHPVIAVIVAIIAGLVLLYNKCEWFRNLVNDFVQDVVTLFTKDIPDAWNYFVRIITSVGGKIKNIAITTKDAIKTVGTNVLNFFTKTIPNAVNKLKDSMVNKVKVAVDATIKYFVELPNRIWTALGGSLYNLGFKIGYAFGTAIDAAITVFYRLPAKISEILGELVKKIPELSIQIYQAVTSWIDESIPKIIEWGTNLYDTLTTWVTQTIEAVVTWFSTLPQRIEEWLTIVINNIIAWATNLYNTMTTWISNTINAVIEYFSQLPAKIWTFLVDVVNKIIQFGKDAFVAMTEAAQQIWNAIVDKLSELPAKMLEIGRNIVEGLWQGIQNAKDWLLGKLSEFCGGILDGMKSALGIHSPSRLFRDEVGRYIAEGIGVGFEQTMPKVIKDMQSYLNFETSRLAATLDVNGMDKKLGSVAASGGIINNNINMNISTNELSEATIDRVFNYINKKFGSYI